MKYFIGFGMIGLAFGLSSCTKTPLLKAVKTAPALVESTVTTISSGTVDAEQQAILNFGVTGRIAKIYAKVGDSVRKGQKIAELENADLRIIWEDASKEWERSKQLFEQGLVSRVAFDEAKRALQVAKSNYDKSFVRATFDGLLTEVNLQLGEQGGLAGTKPPVRLVDLKPRVVRGDIDEVDLAKVRLGQPARVRIPAASARPFEAVVSRVIPYVDTTKEQDRTSQIELRLGETASPVPVGASAEIEIVVDRKPADAAVPARLVLGTGAERYAFRYQDGKLIKTPIRLGVGNYDRLEIISGLKGGEIVVYPSDEMDLKDGLNVKVEIVAWP